MDPECLARDYLRIIWDSDEVRADIETRARTSAGIHKINLTNLAAVKVPLPPRTDQVRLAKTADAAAVGCSAVCATVEGELAAIKVLPAALLRRAFAGDL